MAADKSPKSATKVIKKNARDGKWKDFIKHFAKDCKVAGKKFDLAEAGATWKGLDEGQEYTFTVST